MNHRIKPDDVGKQVPFLGGMEYTHVVWAEEMIALTHELSLESRTEYLFQVMNTLPNTVRDNLRGQTTNWTQFTDAVKDIDIENLTRQVKRDKEQHEKEKAVETHIKDLNVEIAQLKAKSSDPTAAIQAQLRKLNLHRQTVTTSGEDQTVPATPGHYEAQSSRPRPAREPISDADKTALQQQLQKYPQQPDTDGRQAAYQRQIAQWSASRGANDPVTKNTLVPLKPGPTTICSGECFRCGTHGHRAIQCRIPDGHPNCLTREKSRWQAICGARLGPINRTTTMEVLLIFDEQEIAQQGWEIAEDEHDEGKGEGLPA